MALTQPSGPEIQRHKTAIRRPGLSFPVKCLLRDGLLDTSRTLFDYGSGQGQDLVLLGAMGIACDGWDPAYRPDAELRPADVVNLGYVINVVEDPRERAEALQQAWSLSRCLLVVSAQLVDSAPRREQERLNDGVLTSRGTFQKYYTQAELREYVETLLGVEAVPAAPGVLYLFRDESARQQLLASRFRRTTSIPARVSVEQLYDRNLDLLEPFTETLARLGRPPGPEEFPQHMGVVQRFGSIKRAIAIVQRATGSTAWEGIAARRREDLLVYLALARFGKRPPLSRLPLSTQRDVKAFFRSYQEACSEADALLFRVGDPSAIDAACQRSSIGHLVHNALLLRRDLLGELAPLLRVYEGCARALVGEVEEANVVKLHRLSGKVSYLAYPDLDATAEPSLRLRVKVTLPNLAVDVFDYSEWAEPPRLEYPVGVLAGPLSVEGDSLC